MQCSTVLCSTVQNNDGQCSAVWCRTVQCSMTKFSAVQYSWTQFSASYGGGARSWILLSYHSFTSLVKAGSRIWTLSPMEIVRTWNWKVDLIWMSEIGFLPGTKKNNIRTALIHLFRRPFLTGLNWHDASGCIKGLQIAFVFSYKMCLLLVVKIGH